MHNRMGHRFQRRLDIPNWLEPKTALAYYRKVLNTQPGNLIAYWPLWELAGANADNLEGTVARDGNYVGPTLGQQGFGDGNTAPLFDGINDSVDIYSVSLNGAFNNAEGSVAGFIRMSGAGVWTDATVRQVFSLRADFTNRVLIGKSGANNRFNIRYEAAGASKELSTLVLGGRVDNIHLGMSWSVAADEVRHYIDGVQVGATMNGLGVWAGALNITHCRIGAKNNAQEFHSGYEGHWAVWTTPLTDADFLRLATI